MSILQFLRIVWAYRILILVSTLVCFIAGVATVQLVRPRYEAQSRVMLDVIKPDPVTGQVMATAFLRAYTKTQIELVKDLQVARRVVDDLHWDKDPAIRREYRNRNKDENLEFSRWAAQKIMAGANAKLIEGSNILEISYGSNSPEQAKAVADALRKAYVEMTLQSRQETARRNADWYESQAEKAKTMLFQAESTKSAYERANGIVLQDDKVDIDSARLSALASQGSAPVIAPAACPGVASSYGSHRARGRDHPGRKDAGPEPPDAAGTAPPARPDGQAGGPGAEPLQLGGQRGYERGAGDQRHARGPEGQGDGPTREGGAPEADAGRNRPAARPVQQVGRPRCAAAAGVGRR
jgi:capsular polysaccharide biosynthesis protein